MGHGWFVVRWLHILAMAFFLGGQLFLTAIVVPVERRAPDRRILFARSNLSFLCEIRSLNRGS